MNGCIRAGRRLCDIRGENLRTSEQHDRCDDEPGHKTSPSSPQFRDGISSVNRALDLRSATPILCDSANQGAFVAHIRPFAGIHYAARPELDLSNVIAPPYDVLDVKEKAALQAKHPNNIVSVDLPWL